jgi:predicted exporter
MLLLVGAAIVGILAWIFVWPMIQKGSVSDLVGAIPTDPEQAVSATDRFTTFLTTDTGALLAVVVLILLGFAWLSRRPMPRYAAIGIAAAVITVMFIMPAL